MVRVTPNAWPPDRTPVEGASGPEARDSSSLVWKQNRAAARQELKEDRPAKIEIGGHSRRLVGFDLAAAVLPDAVLFLPRWRGNQAEGLRT